MQRCSVAARRDDSPIYLRGEFASRTHILMALLADASTVVIVRYEDVVAVVVEAVE